MTENGHENGHIQPLTDEEIRGITEAEFSIDIALQLAALREKRGLTQQQLAEECNTSQQLVSRFESTGYSNYTLRKLREFGRCLDAYLDVVVVPAEQLDSYLETRYQPTLMEVSPSVRVDHREFIGYVSTDSTSVEGIEESVATPVLAKYSLSRADFGLAAREAS